MCMATAMLELMGLGELIARDERHYVELAVALGREPALRQRLRTLREAPIEPEPDETHSLGPEIYEQAIRDEDRI